ncbi:MAG TPA: PepSY domain-containing protein, partial [Phenylobacterium sp.]
QTSHALFGAPPPPQRPSGPGRNAPPIPPAMSLDQAVAAAGGGMPATVNYPTRGKAPAWRLEFTDARKTLQVIDATGEVKAPKADRPTRGGEGGGDPTSKLMRQVHDGNDMGLVWQLIITITGLAPAVLGITGVVMWLRRRARKRAIRHGMAA